MNIFELLKNKKVPPNEKAIVDFILEQPMNFLEMNIQQIAEKCYVSRSTIYRLCDRLELRGLAELKLKVSASLDTYWNNNEDFDYDFPITGNTGPIQVAHKIKEDYQRTMDSTFGFFSDQRLKNAVKAMSRAKVIDIYTSAGHTSFARNFQFQMQEIGKVVNVPVEEYRQRLTASTSDESHLAIIISFAGGGLIIDMIAKILAEKGTPILLISAYESKFKLEKAAHHLYMCPYEDHYNKISSFSTRFSLLYILDVLYTCYFDLDYEGTLDKKLEYYSRINKFREY